MPEESAPVPSEPTKEETNLDAPTKAPPKTITFQKTKFIVLVVVGVLVLVLLSVGSYFLGQDSARKEVVAEKADKPASETKEKEDIPDLVEAKLGEEVKAKNGIAIALEEAKHDATFEKQKEESKKYYEKNASQSASLDTEYYKQSSLVLKISVTNTTDKVAYYSPSSFRLKDSKDNQYTSGYGYEGGSPQTSNSSINPSETTKMTISYIVPTSEKNFTIIYENVVIEFSI